MAIAKNPKRNQSAAPDRAAEAFISYLTDRKNAAVWRKAGLEPINR